ncbi:MAG: bifunctional folylpolyglutamate synthase/dihydrofolate synthase [Turicibacter sp.]|nr:bifunctional folylpolyglutamate synthase/dihydrofolate synthase [Turicibacter sp.]
MMRMETYNDALEYLYSSYSNRAKAGLDGVYSVLDRVGNPHSKLKVIHVAGTNGKGSTCTILKYILMEAGYSVGCFTSPHLERYNERIAINLADISDEDFIATIAEIAAAADFCGVCLSFFEILTCMAYLHFANNAVDIAIMEIGIGGRLDATNVIENPILSVITAPGYDHTEILGETLEQIATEDAGIIKQNCPVAVYPSPVFDVIERIANAKNAPFYYIGDKLELKDTVFTLENTRFSVNCEYFSYTDLKISLLGKHQVNNAIHALLCAEVLSKSLTIKESHIISGLAKVRWPGRFEVFQSPLVVLDGAHNEDGAAVFKEAIGTYFKDYKIVIVLAITQSKDCHTILEKMVSVADTIIVTDSGFRGIPINELTEIAKRYTDIPILSEKNPVLALKKATEIAGAKGAVTITGSLYLVGKLRSTLI